MIRNWTNLLYGRSLCSDDWWLEYLEGEIREEFHMDIELLLKKSPGDYRKLAQLAETRELISDSDDVHAPEDDRLNESLHDRIMAALEGAVPVRTMAKEITLR